MECLLALSRRATAPGGRGRRTPLVSPFDFRDATRCTFVELRQSEVLIASVWRGHNTSGGYYQSYVRRTTKILYLYIRSPAEQDRGYANFGELLFRSCPKRGTSKAP